MTIRRVQPPRRLTLPLLVLFAALVCLRMPEIILKGRFWAEEGRYFFVDAWTMTPLHALFFPIGGYLNLLANAATLGARWLVPLQDAPYVTIAVALSVQLLPPLLLLTARDPWLQSLPVRAGGALLLLLTSSSDEIWLQTLHCQFELTVCCALILGLQTVSGAAAAARLLLLFVAPLCGPGAIVLLPMFLLRLLADRSVPRLLQCLALAAGSLIQTMVFLTPTPDRTYGLTLSMFLSILTVRHLALPFLGNRIAEMIAVSVRHALMRGHASPVILILPCVILFFGFLASVLRLASRPAFWFLAAGLLIAMVSYIGAIGHPADLIDTRFGARYAFVPQTLFELTLLVFAATSSRKIALCLWLIVAWQLVVGATTFIRPWPLVADGPAWRPQVAAWRLDPTVRLQTWPTGWSLVLPPHP